MTAPAPSRVPPARSIRLPLQIGSSALVALERAALYLVPSLVIGLILSVPALWLLYELADEVPDFIAKYLFMALVLPAVPFYFAVQRGWDALSEAVDERPSDLVIDGDEVRVQGGPHHGLAAKLGKTKCSIEGAPPADGTDDDGETTLAIGSVVVASADRLGERRALVALHQTLEALSGPPPPAAPDHAIELVTCATCGAPAVPADAATVVCASCGASVPVPDEVRERCRALVTLAETGPRNQRRLRSLLRQPSARTSNRRILAIGAPMMLMWPAAVFIGWALHARDHLTFSSTLVLAFGALTIVGALYFLARVMLVDRQGLAVVALHFGAGPPRAAGEAPTCRVCSGPLPASTGSLFVRCAYCGSDNVLGLDVRGDASRETAQSQGLAEALARRSRDRWAFGFGAVLALVALVGDVRLLGPVVRPVGTWVRCLRHGPECGTPLEDLDARCATGDDAACTDVEAKVRTVDRSFDDDSSEAPEALEHGCGRGATGACVSAAAHYLDHVLTEDADRARALLTRGCDQGGAAACAQLGEMIEGRRTVWLDRPLPSAPPARTPEAFALFAKACAAGGAAGCLDEATYHRTGAAEVGVDPDRARALAVRACTLEGGPLPAAPAPTTPPPSPDATAPHLSPGCAQVACDRGDLPQCVALARTYQHGDGVRIDVGRILELDARACDAGGARGCSDLGFHREHGVGAPEDLATAAEMYERGCDGNDPMGCHDLAVLDHMGTGRPKDAAAAARLFQRGCDLGWGISCDALAEQVSSGEGTARDPGRAVTLYQRGCTLGDQDGCFQLAAAYRDGAGVAKDAAEAARRFGALCDQGDADACEAARGLGR